MRCRAEKSRRPRAAGIAALVAAALALAGGCGGSAISDGRLPSAEVQVAVVREHSLYTTDAQASSFTPVAAGGVVDAAYDAGGALWYTREPDSPERPDACELYRAGEDEPRWRFDELAGATGLGFGLCFIWPDPRGGLLFTASAGTIGSISSFRLDPADGTVSPLGPGDSPAIAPDGARLVLSQHRYRARGSYEQLHTGEPGSPSSLAPISPPDRSYVSPAFSPNGRRLAVVSVEEPAGVEVGPPEGPWRPVMASRTDRYASSVAWMPDGRSLLVLAHDRDGHGSLWWAGADGTPPRRMLEGLSASAIRS